MTGQLEDLLALGASELGIYLSVEKMDKFTVLANELKKWNKKINLTSITGDSEIAIKHFADSLTLLKIIGGEGRIMDIGSGAGFPSIPVKIASPRLSIVSADAAEKKILFQRHVARILGLDNFYPVHGRCEEMTSQYAESFDWVVSRALSDIAAFAKLALPFLRSGGRIIAMKGKRGGDEAAFAGAALAEAGVTVVDILDIKLPVTGDRRSLVVMKKIAE